MAAGSKRVCVCGRSKAFPLCDDSHQDERWTCRRGDEPVERAFLAGRRFQNVAAKLAAEHDGALVDPDGDAPIRAATLLTIADPRALPKLAERARSIEARRHLVLAIGVPGSVVCAHLPGAQLVCVAGAETLHAFQRARELLENGADSDTVRRPLARAFVSHAVADERAILPVLRTLRDAYGAELFVCADSIAGGADWSSAIRSALESADVFIALLSQAFHASQFCSFEVGFASALGTPFRLISLDGGAPPPFVQHLQMANIPRQLRAEPWLDVEDVLLEQMLLGLSS